MHQLSRRISILDSNDRWQRRHRRWNRTRGPVYRSSLRPKRSCPRGHQNCQTGQSSYHSPLRRACRLEPARPQEVPRSTQESRANEPQSLAMTWMIGNEPSDSSLVKTGGRRPSRSPCLQMSDAGTNLRWSGCGFVCRGTVPPIPQAANSTPLNQQHRREKERKKPGSQPRREQKSTWTSSRGRRSIAQPQWDQSLANYFQIAN